MSEYLIGALLSGLFTGGIVMVVGVVKDQILLGVVGFIACVISAILLGLLLAIPVAGVFSWYILKKA